VTLAPNFWPTSTNDISADVHQIKVYPNPAQNQIQLDLGATFDGTTQVKVFSLTGSLVKSVVLNGSYQTFQMNVEGLPAGAYIIYANNGSQKATNRFIKQ
jgi:hypothetical protein